jgi:transcriptional regulator with PAS, ATPase and Fis domain
MNSVAYLLRRIDDPALGSVERARLRCQAARELEEGGDYDAARRAMGDLWLRVGERPKTGELDQETAAEVLLRAGSLSGRIGSAGRIAGAEEIAKDLITESITVFEALREAKKVAEARINLALCCWREGAFDEARMNLRDALLRLDREDGELRAMALLRSAVVEVSAGNSNEALRLFTEAAPLFEASRNDTLKGEFHLTFARALKTIGAQERREDYVDRALLEYTAASFHLEKAGHTGHWAAVENSLGRLCFTMGRLAEAHEHLDRARQLLNRLKDSFGVAQVDERRARVMLAQGRNTEAEKIVRAAVCVLEKGDTQPPLTEALVTHGVALARLGFHEQSRRALQRAVEESTQTGDMEDTGRAELAVIEELGGYLTADEMRAIYEHADQLLLRTQDSGTLSRLRACARQVIAAERAGFEMSKAPNFIYASEQTAALLREAHRVAVTNNTVLLSGETGTGKEALAHMMHEWSGRAGEFVMIDCAALSEKMIDSQLFGHRRGSFRDAAEDHSGAVQQTAGGTLFLDGIAELSLNSQAKLLRLIDYGEIHIIGAPTPQRIDVRIIAATNRKLKDQVEKKRFREELFYRLQTFHIEIPPLRERPEDIAPIAEHLIKEMSAQYGKRVTFMPEAVDVMRNLPLKGNVRELRSLIERMVVTADESAVITPENVEALTLKGAHAGAAASPAARWEGCSLEEEVVRYEGELIKRALEAEKGSVTRAARLLGVTHQGLAFILQGRQKELLHARKPVQRRRRSILGTARRRRQTKEGKG